MKLLTKTNTYTIITTVVLFAIGMFVVYKVVLVKLDREIDKQLLSAKEKVVQGLKNGIPPKEFLTNIGQKIYVKEVPKQTQYVNSVIEYIQTNAGEDGKPKEAVTNRELSFQVSVRDKIYEVNISSSIAEGKELGEYIIGVVIIFLIVIVIILSMINRSISASIFSPFYDTLSKIKTWNIKKNETLIFKETNINEFHLLNDTIKDLTQQIKSDYLHMKEFTENVSHEAQTPLSIISTKIELLMQETNYTQKQNELLQQTYQATQRLYKLNQALILLSRIENKQFIETNHVNLNEAIDEKLEVLEDFIDAKQIVIKKEYNKNINVEVNEYLLTILLNNLLINAIKYNPETNGVITITIEDNSFTIENLSTVSKINREYLFERFNKTATSGSLGLGLSLIKKIVDFYNWQITYSHKDEVHKFKIFM
jgi:signal transduction histidine kinase